MGTTGTDVERLWNQALEILRLEMDQQEFETWLRPLRPHAEAKGGLRLEVQNRLVATPQSQDPTPPTQRDLARLELRRAVGGRVDTAKARVL